MHSGQGFTRLWVWRMEQGGGMRVADQHTFKSFNHSIFMKYYQNFMADTVIRVDGNNRYAKSSDHIKEADVSNAPKECYSIWGGQSYGIMYVLEPITKEEYDTFGVKWDFGRSSNERVIL